MSDVSVKVNGNPYRLACAVGDEERIERLAAYVDKTCKALIVKLGQISENRLLLMASGPCLRVGLVKKNLPKFLIEFPILLMELLIVLPNSLALVLT